MAFDLIFSNNGIEQPSASSIREELEQMFVSIWGNKINLDASSKQGQLITSLTTIILEKNASIAKAIQSFNPKTAENDSESGMYWQDAIGNIYGMERKSATNTTVLCNISGRAGTVIPNTAQAISTNGDIFKITQSVTIPSSGQVSVYFTAIESGAIPADAGSINTIYTPVVGWDSVNNTSSGVIGSGIESREDFENRRVALLGKYSTNQVESIKAELLSVSGVVRCIVKENDKDNAVSLQNISLPAHSVYCVVEGGSLNDIGAAIRLRKSGGCSTSGSQSYSDSYGTIYYEIPSYTPVRVVINATETDTTPADIVDTIKSLLVQDMANDSTNLIGIGETLYAGRFYKVLSGLDVNLTSITVGLVGGAQSGSVSFNLNQVASLSAENITVNL